LIIIGWGNKKQNKSQSLRLKLEKKRYEAKKDGGMGVIQDFWGIELSLINAEYKIENCGRPFYHGSSKVSTYPSRSSLLSVRK